jgi:hypothetical protein
MRVKLALLADYSNVSREGKLNILGIFDTIYARTFPTTHPHMQLVIRLEADFEEAGTTRQVEVQFQAQDGTGLFRLPAALTIQRGEAGEPVRADHILTLTNVTFQEPGRYAFHIVVDGRVDTTVPLRVEQLPATH